MHHLCSVYVLMVLLFISTVIVIIVITTVAITFSVNLVTANRLCWHFCFLLDLSEESRLDDKPLVGQSAKYILRLFLNWSTGLCLMTFIDVCMLVALCFIFFGSSCVFSVVWLWECDIIVKYIYLKQVEKKMNLTEWIEGIKNSVWFSKYCFNN